LEVRLEQTGRGAAGRQAARQIDRQTDGRADGRIDGWSDDQTERRTDGRTDGRMDRRTNGQPDGQTAGASSSRMLELVCMAYDPSITSTLIFTHLPGPRLAYTWKVMLPGGWQSTGS
jgi:hypothetical protein